MRKFTALLFCLFVINMGCSTGSMENENVLNDDETESIVSEVVESKGEDEIEEVEVDNEERSDEIEVAAVPKYKLNPTNFLIQPREEGVNEKVVLLTIDDAPDQYGVKMAEILHDLDVNAIFFMNGIFINKGSGKEQLKQIHELGFEIGNHTMTHKNLSELSPEEQRKEIIDLNDLIEEITGERPRFFRAPYGANTDVSKQVVEAEGMQWMNWTYGYDYFPEYMDAESLAEQMVNSELLMNGANLLMHDRKWTMEALRDIVKGLKDKGFDIVDPKEIK
ncbi:polysaccharide deacetylase family protein [Alkalihalobacterium alkalinitrilicum]|uniref:polysaccharide deacetylase family protein n=1 Tax=Alkalihalobacterium alkalinitrilicum TaxID=427920 RepID=UPI0009950413|nr:polysaccharide deacetylase family protein [Alkalihalobacterium alkalinitrilicum]